MIWKLVAVAIIVSFVLHCFWWFVLGAVLMALLHLVITKFDKRRTWKTAVLARADQQHQWVLAGDLRGTYGVF